MTEPIPAVGHPVHYVQDGICKAGVVVTLDQVGSTDVGVAVFDEDKYCFYPDVAKSDDKAEGSWHYPVLPSYKGE